MTLHPREGLILEAANIGRDFDWVMKSRLGGTHRMLALLAVAAGMPIGCAQNGEPLPPPIGYRIHPALIYGGWVNPAKRNSGTQGQKRGEVLLGVPLGFHSGDSAMRRAQCTLQARLPLVENFPPTLVTTPRELGQRHSRLMVGLLLDLVSRCADQSIEAVMEEVALNPTFCHRLDQKEFRRMVGRDLNMNNGLTLLDDLRRTNWSVPVQIQTWEGERFVNLDFSVSIPGISAHTAPEDEGVGDWRGKDMAERDHPDDFRASLFGGFLSATRKTVDVFWDARILGWCWSTGRFLAKRKAMAGHNTVADFREALLSGNESPALFRDALLDTMTTITRGHLRMGLEFPHSKLRSTGCFRQGCVTG